MKISHYISLHKVLPYVILIITINIIPSVKAGVYFSSTVDNSNVNGSGIRILPAGGFVGPVPNIPGTDVCVDGMPPAGSFIQCSVNEWSNNQSMASRVGCSVNLIVTSMTNKTTGRSLTNSYTGGALMPINIGSSAYNRNDLFGASYASMKFNPDWRNVLCSSHEGDSMSVSSNPGYHYLYTKQGFNLGDTIELCVVEEFVSVRGTAYYASSPYATKGPSYCTTLDTVALTCDITGDLNIDLGSVGVGRSAYGETSVMLSCPTTSSVKISMVKQNMEGTIPLRNNGGSTIEAKTRMQVGKSAKSTEWSGTVGLSTPILFSADINNVGSIPGEFSGQTVIILSNN